MAAIEHDHRPAGVHRDRAAVQVEAARPRDPRLFGTLLERTITAMCSPTRRPPKASIGVVANVVEHTPWSGFRTGHARLASTASLYMSMLAPPTEWIYVGVLSSGCRSVLHWRSPNGVEILDVLTDGADERHLVRELNTVGTRLAAVRMLRLNESGRWTVHARNEHETPLLSSAWSTIGAAA